MRPNRQVASQHRRGWTLGSKVVGTEFHARMDPVPITADRRKCHPSSRFGRTERHVERLLSERIRRGARIMWYDDLEPGRSWSALWSGYILCKCGGIRRTEGACPVCGRDVAEVAATTIMRENGHEMTTHTFMGAEGRYEDYMYLKLMEREWKRPVTDADRVAEFDAASEPSPRAGIVVQFWSYFETRIERLLRAGMRNLPPRVTEDLLMRYSFIGQRLDRLYRILFDATYRGDLNELGFAPVAQHLALVQERRNDFTHGDPHAIDDALVAAVIENLKTEHEAWVAVFNYRTVLV